MLIYTIRSFSPKKFLDGYIYSIIIGSSLLAQNVQCQGQKFLTENNTTPYLHSVTNFQDPQDVFAHIFYRGVAMNTCDTKDLHIWHSQSHHDSLGIVHSTIHIYEQLLHHGIIRFYLAANTLRKKADNYTHYLLQMESIEYPFYSCQVILQCLQDIKNGLQFQKQQVIYK